MLIEASEESGSPDLPAYVDALADRIGSPELVRLPRLAAASTTSGCGSRRRCAGWSTATLTVEVLTAGVHSGQASGVVPSSFRIIRQLLDRIEDSATGEVLLPELHVEIPADRVAAARRDGDGDRVRRSADEFPFAGGDAADDRRPDRAAPRPDVAPDAQLHRRRRLPADRAGPATCCARGRRSR